MDKPRVAYVYDEALSQYEMSPTHPLKPIRLQHMNDLMDSVGLFDLQNVASPQPRIATKTEVETAHASDYIEIVEAISNGAIAPGMGEYELGTPDNPVRHGMYDTTMLCVGATLTASELVMSEQADVAFAPAGGVHHHAMRRRAWGFGVFNDAVIAMNKMVDAGLRVAYIDIDCHHGDGVQAGHYESDQVLTISIHESGQWLFSGTGYVPEIGQGAGTGYSVNIPLAPYTQDDEWHRMYDAVIPNLVRSFKPDVLFTQLGIDTHYLDPITHLSLTTQGFERAVQKLARLGADVGKWVAVGGGGYYLSGVARAWTMALAEMAQHQLPENVPANYSSLQGLTTFADPLPAPSEPQHFDEITKFNDGTLEELQSLVFPRFSL